MESKSQKVMRNLNSEQLTLMQNLSSDKSIIIKPADKGGGIVVLNKVDYLFEVERQLADTSAYIKVSRDPTQVVVNVIRMVQEGLAMDYISKELADYLIPEHPWVPIFYLLPKIHKPGFPPRGRPIIAAQESALENIKKYIL